MKRLLACGCLAFALASPATAGWANSTTITRYFDGTVKEGGTLSFSAKVKTIKKKHHKKKVKVTSLLPVAHGIYQVQNVVLSCDQGDFYYSYGWYTNERVRNNRFNRTVDTDGFTDQFKGHFMNKGKTVAGTFRASGGDASHTNCDTGIVHWKASKVKVT